MEHSTSLAAYLAYAVIVVFLLIVLAAMLRALMLPFLLVTMELGKKFWHRWEKGGKGSEPKS